MPREAPDFGYSLDEDDLVYFYSFDFVLSLNTTTGDWFSHMPIGWVYFDWPFYYELDQGILWFAWPPAGGIGVYHVGFDYWEVLPQVTNTLIYEKTTKTVLNIQGLIYNYGFQVQNKYLDYLLGMPI